MSGRTALFVGDASFDLTMTVSHVPEPDEKLHVRAAVESPGGVATNAAVACALAGTPARLIIAVGDDVVGRMLVDQVKATSVDLSWRARPGATCRVVVLLEPHGKKRLLLHPGVSMFPRVDQLETASLDGIGWLHLAVYDVASARHLVDRCRAQDIPWSLDLEPSTFPEGLSILRDVIAGASTLFCNARAVAQIGTDAITRLIGMGAASVVETRGADGAILHEGDIHSSVPAPKVQAVDTTGAGDCLAGWFIAERLRGALPQDAAVSAVAAATMSCTRLGGQVSYPTRANLARVIK